MLLLWAACADPEPETVGEVDKPTIIAEDPIPIPDCSFQIQSINNLMGGKHKVVQGKRTCKQGGLVTWEIILFAPGEAIDNHKKCNVFATTDSTSIWELRMPTANRIDVIFYKRLPADSTILLKLETVYDSIEVNYTHQEKPIATTP